MICNLVRAPTISLPPEGEPSLYGQLPALLRAKCSVAPSSPIPRPVFPQGISRLTTLYVPN